MQLVVKALLSTILGTSAAIISVLALAFAAVGVHNHGLSIDEQSSPDPGFGMGIAFVGGPMLLILVPTFVRWCWLKFSRIWPSQNESSASQE
jgi:hypothetical protein